MIVTVITTSFELIGELRERIQLALKPLEGDSAAFIADLLTGSEPERVPYGHFVLPWMLLTVVAVGAALAHLIPLWLYGHLAPDHLAEAAEKVTIFSHKKPPHWKAAKKSERISA